MKLEKIIGWLDAELETAKFSDVSNNGLQIARSDGDVDKVALAVDGSRRAVLAAAEAGAQLLVVHHGISWGGGIKRIAGSEYAVIAAAIKADVALYAVHLPLDAHPKLGHNALLAKELKLTHLSPAFSYHGNIIGLVGVDPQGRKIGVCSGGGGEFAAEAKALGCVKLVTGEADWGETVAAENVGIELDCRGHYETELYGIQALAKAMKRALKIETVIV
ncbi:MAG: Nif3-like dinuclear metal center hexameric protein [Kiritimatiellae bacterium]|nr:Nif3-like dinuclear metal center hexameric protein [Kiritimatiellia bacterium]